jgi:two-component system, OmpR family, response regulator
MADGPEFRPFFIAALRHRLCHMTCFQSIGSSGGDVAPLRVLVVDDLVDAAQTMARLLKLLDCEVQTAHTGQLALQIAGEFSPHIVLLDLGLPGMDGFEVARSLRVHPLTTRAMIVALSGYGDAAAREQAAEAGCDEHWLKPARIEQLKELIAAQRSAVQRVPVLAAS